VYLTLLGGGAFGNPTDWIVEAIWKALQVFEYAGLDVAIVSYGQSNPDVQELVEMWAEAHEEESSSSSSSSDSDSE
jgi:arsenate reductase-like glutaredoxin family protein